MNALADVLAPPSRHMRAYLRQRGWALPADTRVIPNVLPPAQAPPPGQSPELGPNRHALPMHPPVLQPSMRLILQLQHTMQTAMRRLWEY